MEVKVSLMKGSGIRICLNVSESEIDESESVLDKSGRGESEIDKNLAF